MAAAARAVTGGARLRGVVEHDDTVQTVVVRARRLVVDV
jgi:hypothetical protein